MIIVSQYDVPLLQLEIGDHHRPMPLCVCLDGKVRSVCIHRETCGPSFIEHTWADSELCVFPLHIS